MSAIAEFQPQFLNEEEEEQDLMIQFEDNAFEPATPYQEDFEDQVHVAQEELANLRQKQEQLERQKTELEELSQKKEAFTAGRIRILAELEGYNASLTNEADEAQRRADECIDTKEIFEHHMRTVQCLRPESWSRADLRGELARAISYIDSAEDDIAKAHPLLSTFGAAKKKMFKQAVSTSSSTESASAQPFSYWVKAGLAFTLPLMAFAVVMSIVMAIFS